MCRSSHGGTVEAKYQLEGCFFAFPLLAPGGLLFCVAYKKRNGFLYEQDHRLGCADAATSPPLRAGAAQLRTPSGCVWGQLFVCDTGNHRLQVFSLTVSTAARSRVSGGRLSTFAVRRTASTSSTEKRRRRSLRVPRPPDPCAVVAGRRPAGRHAPHGAHSRVHVVCCFDGKLASFLTQGNDSAANRTPKYGMLALRACRD